MNWRRGLLLAGIHLVAAAPLILMLEARDAKELRDGKEPEAMAQAAADWAAITEKESHSGLHAAHQEGETVSFDCGGLWAHYPAQEAVVRLDNSPAAALTGWRYECRAKWTLSAMLEGPIDPGSANEKLAAQRKIDAVFCVVIAIQWLLVGAFPLKPFQKTWGEPGILITAFTVIAACLALIPSLGDAALLPASLAGLAWFWWFALLVWAALRFGWRRITGLYRLHQKASS
jgi:hypothetical protein